MSFGDVLWSLLTIYFIFFYIMILFRVIGDLFSDQSAGGVEKTGWVLFLLFLPFVSLCTYLIVRGKGMAQRTLEHAQAANASQEAYIRQVAGSSGSAALPTQRIADA